MQNVGQGTAGDGPKIADKVVHHDIGNSPSTPHSTSNSSPAKSETETYSEHRRYMSDTSGSEDDSVSEVRFQYLRSPEAQVSLHPERDILWQSVRSPFRWPSRLLPIICKHGQLRKEPLGSRAARQNKRTSDDPSKQKTAQRPLLGEKNHHMADSFSA